MYTSSESIDAIPFPSSFTMLLCSFNPVIGRPLHIDVLKITVLTSFQYQARLLQWPQTRDNRQTTICVSLFQKQLASSSVEARISAVLIVSDLLCSLRYKKTCKTYVKWWYDVGDRTWSQPRCQAFTKLWTWKLPCRFILKRSFISMIF